MRLGAPAEEQGAARRSMWHRNQAAGAALRAEKDRIFHRDVARSVADERRASGDELAELSALLNAAQRVVVPPWESASWLYVRLCQAPVLDGARYSNGMRCCVPPAYCRPMWCLFLPACRTQQALSAHRYGWLWADWL